MESIVAEAMPFAVSKVAPYKVIASCIVLSEALKRTIFSLPSCDGTPVLSYFSESAAETASWYPVGVSAMTYVDTPRILVFDVYHKEFFIEVDDATCVNVDVMVASAGTEPSTKVTLDVPSSPTSTPPAYPTTPSAPIFSENVNGNETVIRSESVVVENPYESVLSELSVPSQVRRFV